MSKSLPTDKVLSVLLRLATFASTNPAAAVGLVVAAAVVLALTLTGVL